MILTVTLNAAVDHILFVEGLKKGDTNRVREMQTDAGGKGVNVSRVVAGLGGDSVATGFLGGGPGAFVRHVLERSGVGVAMVETKGETRTNLSVESGDGPPTTFNARGPEISGEEWEALLASVQEMAGRARWVSAGGSLPPGLGEDAFAKVGGIAKSAGALFALDADGGPMLAGMGAGPDLIKPNVREAERLLGRPLGDEGSVLAAARELGDRVGVAVVSMGARGAVMCAEGELWVGEPVEVEVRSTIGSGDSMVGGMLWAREEGMDWGQALRWGLAAGAATATTDGTEIGRMAVIEELVGRARVRRA